METEEREPAPEQRNDQAEGQRGEAPARPANNWEGYSLETLTAFFDG